MLISAHVLSGALLGRAVGRPAAVLALGIGSHLVLDGLPHWGTGDGWPPGVMSGDALRVARVDGVAGLALIALTAWAAGPDHRLAVLAGITGACAPDLDKPGRLWFGRSPWPARFDRLHAELQVDVERPELLRHDVVLAAVAAVATLGLLRRTSRAPATR